MQNRAMREFLTRFSLRRTLATSRTCKANRPAATDSMRACVERGPAKTSLGGKSPTSHDWSWERGGAGYLACDIRPCAPVICQAASREA